MELWKLISVLGVSLFLNTLFVLSAVWHTAEENEAINKFRPLVAEHLTVDYMKADGFLLQYLRASKFNLKKAVAQMDKTRKWRQKHDLDNVFKEDLSSYRRALPYFNEGVDNGGRPLVEFFFGKWDIRKYDLAGKRSTVLKHEHQFMERLNERVYKLEEEMKRDIGQTYVVVDFDGYSLRKQTCLGCIPLMLDMARSCDSIYLVNMRNLTLINVPGYFRPVLVLVKEIFGERAHILTQYGIEKREWTPALLNDISIDQLSVKLGGTRPNSTFDYE